MSQKIIESKKITDIFNYINDETLVVFDIDNTLIERSMNCVGDAWFDHKVEELKQKGLSKQEAREKLFEFLLKVDKSIPLRTVEKTTAEVVQNLQDKNITIMGLTGRWFAIRETTCEQLRRLGITLSCSIYKKKLLFEYDAGFCDGILYIGPRGKKGAMLLSFFEKVDYAPKHILFIDDDQAYINDVYEAITAKNISCTCIHYVAAFENSEAFDPARADQKLRAILLDTKGGEELMKEIP